ncbi:hypothetical protein K502DRAFT_289545 [Neoconidiobolus thromboides FSU 785]|nr:hypothetical protein K502DRAFT_289545 [Neoconidiobolus thromboides FSU 785]
MICRVNAVRAKAGKKPLYVDNCLMKSAHDHSQEQAKNKKMTHSGFDGKTKELGGRLTLSGYTWNSCAENIAWNQQTIKQVVDDWTKSKGHYANMIGDYDCFGWGEVDKYWTQNFASGKKCTSTTLPQCNGY